MIRRLAVLFPLIALACGDKDVEDTAVEDVDGDGFTVDQGDCDDNAAWINPDAYDSCTGNDDDCDGEIDEDGATPWFADVDNDGYGDATDTVNACEQPAGYVVDDSDCDDAAAAFHPGASETDCTDPNDYNCDGSVGYADEDGDTFAACEDCDDTDATLNPDTIWYGDADGDTYGGHLTAASCLQPSGFVATQEDCDDLDPNQYPGADELCNDEDDDCDGTVDNDPIDPLTWYADLDEDGYGNADDTALGCEPGEDYVDNADDCDDTDETVNPDTIWYSDSDGDGFGGAQTNTACEQPAGWVDESTDCDDTDADSYPGADEYCNGDDNDCDGTADNDAVDWPTWYYDYDGDGYGDASITTEDCDQPSDYLANDDDCDDTDSAINPDAEENCDQVDNDCDGSVDYGFSVDGTNYTSVQDAVDDASSGDIVCVFSGTYTETVDFAGKDIDLIGSGSDEVTIDGDGSGPVLDLDNVSGTISGLTITGGDHDEGAGVHADDSFLSFDDVIITANECTSTTASNYCVGVGLYAEDAEFDMVDVEITDNVSSGFRYGYYGYHRGVGAYMYQTDLTAEDLTVDGNSAEFPVGGTQTYAYNYGYGVGMWFYDGDLNLQDASFSDNWLEAGSGSYSDERSYIQGGGAYIYYSDIDLDNVQFDNNYISNDGAGNPDYVRTYGGGAWFYYNDGEMDNVSVSGNWSDDTNNVYGGGMYTGGNSIVATNMIIAGNTFSYDSSSTYSSSYGYGVAWYLTSEDEWELTNASITGNSGTFANTVYGTVYQYYYNTNTTLLNVDVSNNTLSGSTVYGSAWYCSSSSCSTYSTAYTDVTSTDATAWDLTLGSSSGLIDVGDTAILDADGTTSDIGAHGGPGAANW
jgi:hypothetical protein